MYTTPLKYVAFESEIELAFYSALNTVKIDHDRLDAPTRRVVGLYEAPISVTGDSCRIRVQGNAMNLEQGPPGSIRAEGTIKNYNTAQDFRSADYNAVKTSAGKQIWDAIVDGSIYSAPSLLASVVILAFSDLKKYRFQYWCLFPALQSQPQWVRNDKVTRFTSAESISLVERMGTYRYATDVREHGFFLVKKVRGRQEASLDGEKYERQESGSPDGRRDGLGFLWEIASLREFEQGFFTGVDPTDQYIGFVDPSTYADTPGWVLRNLLVLIRHRFRLSKARILCYRDVHSKRHEARSIILNVESLASPTEAAQNKPEVPPMPSITGWERDLHGNLRPRLIDLAQYMDPGRLADQSVDLNLKLMKWRIAPDLDLERIKNAKCLLLGAGTLGSNVSRMLQGWNVRKITFVDNATVSYSNPVRQPLFAYKDCLNGGAKKALRAAEQLKEIYPGTDSSGHVISVPMLGHPIIDEKAIHQDFEQLRALIDEHDAIFLLMDTRESRWLPTLMGKAANKIVMNAALGFDTFVAMRHGIAPPEGGQAALGCYFCNDVVAPEDSMKDQTLDQQCTVTRPGLAAMASATLVELFVSILQHPLGGLAPAPGQPIDVEISEDNNHPLGIVPHQIRYFLRNFESRNIRGQSYDCCSACSSKVVDAYKAQGWNFVRRALSEKDYVTELSGLAEVHRRADAAAAEVDWDSEEGSAEDDAEAVLL